MPKFRKTKRQLNNERKAKLEEQSKALKAERKIQRLVPKVVLDTKQTYSPKPRGRPDSTHIPSKGDGVEPVRKVVLKEKYEGEMAEREAAAQSELRRKSKRVAIAYSKGAYQYITEGTDPKEIGRKNPN